MSDTTHFTPGDYKTEDGRNAKIFAIEPGDKGKNTLFGILERATKKNWVVMSWYANGRRFEKGHEHDVLILPETKAPEVTVICSVCHQQIVEGTKCPGGNGGDHEYHFSVGDHQTRSGRLARILSCVPGEKGHQTLIGMVWHDDTKQWAAATWYKNGDYYAPGNGNSSLDLMRPYKHEWINIYPTPSSHSATRHLSRLEAERCFNWGRIGILHLTFSQDGKQLIKCEMEKV